MSDDVATMPGAVHRPFGIKQRILFAFGLVYGPPLALFAPLVALELANRGSVKRLGVTKDNFSNLVQASQVLTAIFAVAAIAYLLRRSRLDRSDLALNRVPLATVARYVLGIVAVLAITLAMVGILMKLVHFDPAEAPTAAERRAVFGGFVAQLLITVVLAPVVEEILFRGILESALLRQMRPFIAIMITSVVFVVFHLNPAHMVSIIPMAFYISYVRYKTASVLPGILIHALWNLMVLLVAQAGS